MHHSSSLLTSEGGSSSIFGFAPAYAWGVCHSPSLLTSELGSSYGSRGRPPNTTGRAVLLAVISEGVLGGKAPGQALRHRAGLQRDQHPQGPWTNNACGHNSTLISKSRRSNDEAIESPHEQEELSSRLEDVECGRHEPFKSRIGPRLYTTSLRLHQPRLNSSLISKLRRSNDKAIESSHEQELFRSAGRCRVRPSQASRVLIGPRFYTTSLRLHQPWLNPSTWRGGTTSRLPLPAHNAGDSSRPPDEGDAGRLSISMRTALFYFRGGLVFN